jgi:uncharacterized delta-60 repeat protein
MNNAPPTVQIVQPTDHAVFFVPAGMLLVAHGGDPEGDLQQVEFFADTNSLGLATRLIEETPEIWPPELAEAFGLYWTNVPVERYRVTARATDGAGNITTSAPVHLAVVPETVTVVNIAATDPEARELPPLVPGFDDATCTIQRTGNTNVDLVVRYLISGTASNGVDYAELSGWVRMAAGVTNADITFFPLDDTLVEGTETVILTVISPFYGPFWPPPPECYLTGPNASATAYIYDYVPPTNQPPTITSQPVSQTNYAGRTLAFDVQASGTGVLSYQWLFNGNPVASERNWSPSALVLTNIQPADAGNYWVVVSDSGGAATSAVATLTVVTPAVHPGAFDPTFQARLGSELDEVFDVVRQTNGQVVISGAFSSVNGVPRPGIARLNADGSLDIAFNPSPNAEVEALAVQSDGKLLVGGAFTNVNGLRRDGLVRLLPDGTVDPGFLPNLPEYVRIHALAVQADGKILTAAELPRMADCNLIIRLFSDGSLDPGFVFSPMRGNAPTVRIIVPQPDGKILLGGDFAFAFGDARRGVARLNNNGYLDYSFNAGTGAFAVSELVLQADGRIVMGGAFDTVNGVPRRGLARLMPNGSVDTNFVANTECCLWALALQPDGKILIGGGFRTVNGVVRNGVARLLPDGSVDLTFDPGSGLSPIDDSGVLAMVIQDDGSIIIGGTQFVAYDGFPCIGLARLHGGSATGGCRLTSSLCPQTGLPQVMLTGPVGAVVVIEATSDLRTWIPLTTVTNTLGGVEICDPGANGSPQRFYRARGVD